MTNMNLEDAKKSKNLWAESGYSSDTSEDDMLGISNLTNMISMASISGMSSVYMPNTPTIVNVNMNDALQENKDEKGFPKNN